LPQQAKTFPWFITSLCCADDRKKLVESLLRPIAPCFVAAVVDYVCGQEPFNISGERPLVLF
jgi:hypothetical protein